MEVTPQVLHEVEFRAKVRGYDPDEVDDFLERVAAGVAQLQDRLREAVERATAAEAKVADLQATVKAGGGPASSDAEETLRRTLVLAQRTADAAVKEATDEADRVVADASARASSLLSEAEARAGAIVKDAEDEVRKGVDATRQRLVAEIIDLEATRDSVRADVAALDRHLDEQRLRLRGAVADLQRLLDDPAALKGLPAPLLTEATLPARFAAEAAAPARPEPEPEPEVDVAALGVEAEDDSGAVDEDDLPPIDDRDDGLTAGPPRSVPLRRDAADVVDMREPADFVGRRDDEDEDLPILPGGRIGLFDDLDDDTRGGFEFDGPDQPTEPVLRIPEGPEGDDAYLAELRKAMLTTQDDEDDDDDSLVPPADDQAPRFRSRFGRRR